MRQFSDLEKLIVKRLAEWEAILKTQPTNHMMVSFDTLVKDIAKKYNGRMTISVGLGIFPKIEFETADPSSIGNMVANNKMTREILDTVNFVDYLSKNELIFFISPNSILPTWITPTTLGVITGTATIHTSSIDDNSFIEKVKSFYGKDIYPTQTLLDYFANGYKTDEEIRHQENLKSSADNLAVATSGLAISIDSLNESKRGLKISEDSLEESKKSILLSTKALEDSQENLKIARFSLWVAIGLGLLGILVSVGEDYYGLVGEQNPNLKIDSIQFKSIESQLNRFEKFENKLDTLISVSSAKDTVITKVVNFPKK
jgi:hypothetical protein